MKTLYIVLGLWLLLAVIVDARTTRPIERRQDDEEYDEEEEDATADELLLEKLEKEKQQHLARVTCANLYEACYAFSLAASNSDKTKSAIRQSCTIYYIDQCYEPVADLYACWANCSKKTCGMTSRFNFNGNGGFQSTPDADVVNATNTTNKTKSGTKKRFTITYDGHASTQEDKQLHEKETAQSKPSDEDEEETDERKRQTTHRLRKVSHPRRGRKVHRKRVLATSSTTSSSSNATNTTSSSTNATTSTKTTTAAPKDYFPTINFYKANCLAACDCSKVGQPEPEEEEEETEERRVRHKLIQKVHWYHGIGGN